MNSRNPIAFFSHYAREDAKLSLSRQMTAETGLDIWDIPGVKGLFIGDGFIGVATAEDHPSQGSLIPTELKRADYKGVPIVVQYHGYSYHLSGSLDHPDDARGDAYFLEKGYARGGGGGSGAPQGGTQIVCGQEYGTAGGVFVDKQDKQYITCSWHVVQQAKGGAVNKGTGNRDAPQSAGKIANVGKNGCSCGGGSQGIDSKKVVDGSAYSQLGYYGIGTPVNFDYAIAYPALFGRSIDQIPYIGRRPLDHNFYQRGGGSRGGGGGRRGGGTFWLDDTANPLTVKGLEEVLGLGKPKGFRRAVMNEKLSFRGVRSSSTKTMPVTGLNYTDRGGICGTCTDMVVTYPCPLPGDSGASFWGSDGYLVCVVTDGSNSKGGNGCTAYNCSMIHIPECFGVNIRGGVDVVGQQPLVPGKEVTGQPISPAMIQAQEQRLSQYKAQQQQSYFGRTIAVA